MAKSKLRTALAAEKGVDFKTLKQKRKAREATKQKRKSGKGSGATAAELSGDDEEGDEDWEDEDEEDNEAGLSGLIDDIADEDNSDSEEDEDEGLATGFDVDSISSDSDVEMEEKIERPKKQRAKAPAPAVVVKTNGTANSDEDDEDDDDEDDESVAWSDLEDLDEDERADLIPHQKLAINNTAALLASLKRIALPTDSSVPFQTHQSIVSSKPTADSIEDIQDDLTRELQFYAQALEAAKKARALLRAEKVPFSRPNDYFAEMIKDDGHMEKVKAKLIHDASAKKASAEARKQRDLKKFGKQVQVAKLQERQKEKKDVLEKIKSLKRKRQESTNDDLTTTEADLFDVAVDNEIKSHTGERGSRGGGGARGGRGGPSGAKRQKKNEKYGFGGKKRHVKSGDAASSGDVSGYNPRKMKGGGPARGGGSSRGGGAFRGGSSSRGGSSGRGGGSGRGGRGGKPPAARPGKARRQSTRGRD